ncbi:MAG TPA: enoyl-CoA hydratase-related protein [Thermoleophilaceae bacterium]|nr:enoyl-CoA hydratase-related protein [Thermoleophilaceae bacterium]
MSEVVTKSVESGVAVLTLNRPDRLNAWTPELGSAYFDLLEECAADDDVRAIVVTGEGRGFCAGADMQDLEALGAGEIDGAKRRQDNRPQTFPTTIPKPIIAAVNGPAAGIGLVLALMCDIRLIADDAKVTTAFARRGLVAEYGIAWILPRLVGIANALDLLFSGRVILGSEAAALGMAGRSLPAGEVREAAIAYARELATFSSPASMAAMKRQLYADLERPLAEGYEEAIRLMLESFERPDFAEGVASFVERREPNFAPVAR